MCHERYAAKVKTSLAIVFFLLSLIAARAEAANSWNERDLNWGPPTACFDGDTDLTHCQVTGYKVEVAGSCTAISWNVLATVGNVTTYHVTNLKPGSYCFRTRAITTGGEGDPALTIPASRTVVTSPQPVKAGPPGATTVS
jgi:hypothetical protein